MAWSVEGTYIEACNCEAACPCIFFSPPTEGERKVVVGWHVDKSCRGDTALDGLNAALIVYASRFRLSTTKPQAPVRRARHSQQWL